MDFSPIIISNRIRLFSFIFFITLSEGIPAQSFPILSFENITNKDGLSSNYCTSVTEDAQGFIWVGTANGLNRYDGYRFKHYFHSASDTNSLLNNAVQRLFSDTHGRLWISTEDGVSCFLPNENKFINYNSKDRKAHSLKNNSSVDVYEDEEDRVWLTNQVDVIYEVQSDFTLKEIKLNLPQKENLPSEGYYKIFRDRQGTEWAFQKNIIYRINKKTKQPEKIFDFSSTLGVYIQKIFQDRNGHYILACWNLGLWQFFPENNSVVFIPDQDKDIYLDLCAWTYKKQDWSVAIAANSGICLIEPDHLSSRLYHHIPGDPTSIQGYNFNTAFADKKNNLWITTNLGISRVMTEQKIFDIIPVTEPGTLNYQYDKSGPVYSYFENNHIWVSKRFVSTMVMDTTFNPESTYYSLSPLSSTKPSANGYAYFFYQHHDQLYITTDSGLVVFNMEKKSTVVYLPPDLKIPPDLRTIIPFRDQRLLIRSYSHGLFVFDMDQQKFIQRYDNDQDCEDCLPMIISYIFKSSTDDIFISTNRKKKGLFKYNVVEDRFVPVHPVNDSIYQLQANDLYGMDEDPSGNLWITSKSGIFVYNPAENKIEDLYTENDQIGSLVRICFDTYGNAWSIGESGVWCFLADKKQWVGFTSEDGLPGSNFEGIITRRKNGDIVAGLSSAIAIFHPERLTKKTTTYPVIITEAKIGDASINFPLMAGVQKLISLSPGQNSFSIDYAILNYLNPASTRYLYKLSPVMKEFQINDNGHLNFNGLAPGQYVLEVKASDKAGNEFYQVDRLDINVSPYWYETSIFKTLSLVALALLIFYFVRRRILTLKNETTLHQRIAKTEMQALRAQMNPHFIFNCLNSIENFILRNDKRLALDYLNKFSNLIRGILESSRNDVVPFSKDLQSLNLYVELEQLRFNHSFRYNLHIEPELLHGDYKVPSLVIQPFVENAIVHGLAQSQKPELNLTISAEIENDKIKYVIEDNGIGRKLAEQYVRQNKPNHHSVGLVITEDRIAHFNKQAKANGAVKIIDLYDEAGISSGTRVEVLLETIT
jgi:ligand-binding sensor domain-containing protein